mmetsp:Transcript_14404/g.46200  ORF Transcript_14404/g.46200 Transcript_14404/m.46200 type:complete len:291 (+) Transcript_14404:175-1047(+)
MCRLRPGGGAFPSDRERRGACSSEQAGDHVDAERLLRRRAGPRFVAARAAWAGVTRAGIARAVDLVDDLRLDGVLDGELDDVDRPLLTKTVGPSDGLRLLGEAGSRLEQNDAACAGEREPVRRRAHREDKDASVRVGGEGVQRLSPLRLRRVGGDLHKGDPLGDEPLAHELLRRSKVREDERFFLRLLAQRRNEGVELGAAASCSNLLLLLGRRFGLVGVGVRHRAVSCRRRELEPDQRGERALRPAEGAAILVIAVDVLLAALEDAGDAKGVRLVAGREGGRQVLVQAD